MFILGLKYLIVSSKMYWSGYVWRVRSSVPRRMVRNVTWKFRTFLGNNFTGTFVTTNFRGTERV